MTPHQITRFMRAAIPDPLTVALGFWSYLGFAMQLCLILVTGFAVGITGTRAGDIGGYTAILGVLVGLIFAVGLVVA